MRFLVLQSILLSAICFLFGNDIETFYFQCLKRYECFIYCNQENYPLLTCPEISTSVTYAGNVYNQLYVYPNSQESNFATCSGYIQENDSFKPSPYNSSRSERLQVCFNSSVYNTSAFSNYIVCAKYTEPCEELYLPYRESTIGGDFDISYVFIGIAIANVFQYLYLFAVIYISRIQTSSFENMKMGS